MSEAGSGADAPACEALPEWGFVIGVIMGVFGSIGINIGQNVQASALQALPELERLRPCQSKKWIAGLVVFIAFSMLNFAALALAPASILTPLESIQFVTNVVYNRFVNHAIVSKRMLFGVGLSLIGTVLSVVFGAGGGGGCNSLEQLAAYWTTNPLWWIYLVLSVSLALGSFLVHRHYSKKLAKDQPPPNHRLVMPIAFTLASALAGGAQMIVHSKVFSELLALLFSRGEVSIFTHWLLYVELVLVILCGMLWVIKLTECLGLFDPLLILPLMVGTYILFGGVAGGIFFKEFNVLHLSPNGLGYLNWVLYLLGVFLVLGGLCLIAIASAEIENDLELDEISEAEIQIEEVEPQTPADAAKDDDAYGRATTMAAAFWPFCTPEPMTHAMTPTAADEPSPDLKSTGATPGSRRMSRRMSAGPSGHSLHHHHHHHHAFAGGHMPTPGAMRAHALHELRHINKTQRASQRSMSVTGDIGLGLSSSIVKHSQRAASLESGQQHATDLFDRFETPPPKIAATGRSSAPERVSGGGGHGAGGGGESGARLQRRGSHSHAGSLFAQPRQSVELNAGLGHDFSDTIASLMPLRRKSADNLDALLAAGITGSAPGPAPAAPQIV